MINPSHDEILKRSAIVIVTYGARAHLLEKTVSLALATGTKHVVIVDNASSHESKIIIKEYYNNFREKIIWICKDKNEGSAGGYADGIIKAIEQIGVEYVLLLDDDNWLSQFTLNELCAEYSRSGIGSRTVLVCNRKDQLEYAIACAKMDRKPLRDNSFLGFHVLDCIFKLHRRIKSDRSQIRSTKCSGELLELQLGVYGGLFFHRDLVKEVGLPDRRFFVYGDDTEYTLRMTTNGFRIFLVEAAEIEDGENSWYIAPQGHRFIDPRADKEKIYSMVRNKAFTGRRIVTVEWMYYANKGIFLSALALRCLVSQDWRARLKRLKLVISASIAGETGNFEV